jgi:GDPmannose 4,6-dehydratase
MTSKRALVIGVTGQDGAYLASSLLAKGYEVIGTSRLPDEGRLTNLRKLEIADRVRLTQLDLTDARAVREIVAQIEPAEIYHLAGQSSVGLSFERPLETVQDIELGTLYVLDAIRTSHPSARLFYAGSSECFGCTGEKAADEETLFRPQSPYAGAKAAAHFVVASYRKAFGLHACTGILFPHESPLRGERFVTRKIVDGARRIARGSTERLRLGNTSIERDWGWAPEYVEAMWLMLQHEVPEDFVIATGVSVPLERFVQLAFDAVGLDWRRHVEVDESLFRPADPARCRANPAKAARVLGWKARVDLKNVVRGMLLA